jgi:hypothetical protein
MKAAFLFLFLFISFLIFSPSSNAENLVKYLISLKTGAHFYGFHCYELDDVLWFNNGYGSIGFPKQSITSIKEVLAEGYLEEEEQKDIDAPVSEKAVQNPLQMATIIAEGPVSNNPGIETSSVFDYISHKPTYWSSTYNWIFGIKRKYTRNGVEWVHVDGTLEPKNDKTEITPLLFRYYDTNNVIVAEKILQPKEMKNEEIGNIYTISDSLPMSKKAVRVEISVVRYSN